MNRGWYWRLGLVLASIVASFVILWPSIPKLSTPWAQHHVPFRLNEGLDIRGGARLSYDVQIGQAIGERRNRQMEDVREQLARDFRIHRSQERLTPDEITQLARKVTLTALPNNRQFVVRFHEAGDLSKITNDFLSRRGLVRVTSSGASVTLSLRQEEVTQLEDTAVRQAIETISNRVDELAIREVSITARGETIVVEVPGQRQEEFNRIRDIIRRTARLEFKILDDESTILQDVTAGHVPSGVTAPSEGATPPTLPTGIEVRYDSTTAGRGRNVNPAYLYSSGADARQKLQQYLDSIRPYIPEGRQVLMGKADRSADAAPGAPEAWRTYTVFSVAQVDGSMISDAQVSMDPQDNHPYVQLQFNRRGAEVFDRVTNENVRKRFAIILDERVNSAPVIKQRISGGNAQITLGGDDYRTVMREANELMVVLRAGALPAPLSEGKQDYIGPTLGSDTIRHARNAMVVGICLVLAFMAVYYGSAGWIANTAVIMNLLLQLSALALFSATITLPGLAGLALTVGMSVDNNVLINERIREELHSGKSIRAAVDAGYNHAFTAIFDGHITTFISGIVLLQYGTGPVKGFAVTLLIGILANLFTGVFATRVVFDWLVKGLKVKTLLGVGATKAKSYDMEIKPTRSYDFMSVRRYWIAFSIIAAVLSAVLIWKPGPRYGIDFLGGTELTVQFSAPVSTDAIREVLEHMGNERPEVVPTQSASRPNEYIIRVEKTSALSPRQRDSIRREVQRRLGETPDRGSLGDFRLSPGGDHLVVQINGGDMSGSDVATLLRESGASVRGDAAVQMGARDDHRWQVPLTGIGDDIFHRLTSARAQGGVGVEGRLNASVWVSPKAGKEGLRDAAIRAVAYSIVFIMIYVAFRFDLRFAPGGILALTHDALVTLGFFVITKKEVTISTVAAILTVVGYSMNDTIIVYDRIRENLARRRNTRMLDVINISVNEMLSRTILTSVTVVLSIAAFAFIGTGVIRDFAWAMIVGVVAGTYSSIYVAAPLTEWIDSRFFHTESGAGDITVAPVVAAPSADAPATATDKPPAEST